MEERPGLVRGDGLLLTVTSRLSTEVPFYLYLYFTLLLPKTAVCQFGVFREGYRYRQDIAL